jgi:hypothetical protein
MRKRRIFDARRAREGAAGILKMEEIARGGYSRTVCFCESIEIKELPAKECASFAKHRDLKALIFNALRTLLLSIGK